MGSKLRRFAWVMPNEYYQALEWLRRNAFPGAPMSYIMRRAFEEFAAAYGAPGKWREIIDGDERGTSPGS